MTTPEKRWQLLLVANDGRIIPFRRIKGIAVTVVILLVVLGLVCAGLGWQLGLEKKRHHLTLDQLAETKLEAAHYRSEHELVAAELVLAEARMEKAGMEIPRRMKPTAEQQPEISIATGPATATTRDDRQTESGPEAAKTQIAAKSSVPTTEHPADRKAGSRPLPTTAPAAADPPAVGLDNFEMTHDAARALLLARFRVNNTGPPSSPVAGRCVVVLKNDQMDPDAWLPLPTGALVNGKPDARRGQAFKISRFIDMDIAAAAPTDPSAFRNATVYVLDNAGVVLLQKEFPIDLPASSPQPEPSSLASEQSSAESSVGGDADESAVDVGDLEVQHDTKRKVLRAQFRVSNTGSPSSPVAGRCVVVLKSEQMDPEAWLVLPDGDLVSGRPNGERGQLFRISRFRDMEIEEAVRTDPAAFKIATVYVFDDAGVVVLLEKDFAIDLPGSEPQPATEVTPDPQISPEPVSENRTVAPPGDSSSPETEKPAKGEDARSRF